MTIFTPCNSTVDRISEAVLVRLELLHNLTINRINMAVERFVLHYINNLEDNLRRDLTSLINEKVTSLRESVSKDLMDYKNQTASDLQSNTQQLCAKMDTLDLKMVSVNASMREELRAMESQLEEYKQQTASELAGLQSSVTSELAGLHTSLQSNTHSEQLTQLCEKVNMLRDDTSSLKGDLSSLNDSMNRISDNAEAHDNHVTTEIMELDQNLQQNFTLLLKNSYGYVTTPPVHTCGGTGGWRRVVYLNFTDPNTPCPFGWQLTSHSKRTCGRVSTSTSCDSVTFPVSGGDYTRVCGRIIGYQYWGPDAFYAYHTGRETTIDDAYVEGVSLTHGSPRQHIWTFAAGASEGIPTNKNVCPCDATTDITIPPFVGGDYFCESGHNSRSVASTLYPDDPLWDGDGCTANSTCCSFNNPPYFTKQLPSPTTDDIEARLCFYIIDDTPIEFIELYVQ